MEEEMMLTPSKEEKVLKVENFIQKGNEKIFITNNLRGIDITVCDDDIYKVGEKIASLMEGKNASINILECRYELGYKKINDVIGDPTDDEEQVKEDFDYTFKIENETDFYFDEIPEINISTKDFYGDNLDLKNTRVKIYYLGTESKPLDKPVRVLVANFEEELADENYIVPNEFVSVDSEEKCIQFTRTNRLDEKLIFKIEKRC